MDPAHFFKTDLQRWALGIGEDHTTAVGRQLVIDLLRSNLRVVENLFVEVPRSWGQKMLDNAAKVSRSGAKQEDVERSLSGLGVQFANSITLQRVIAFAIRRGVGVHAVDGTPGRSNSARNPVVARNVSDITDGNLKRCVVLFGDDHFSGDSPTLRELIRPMRYLKCV